MWALVSCRKATTVALCLLISHLQRALAQAEDVTWLYPSEDDNTFYYKDTINITYESTVSLPYVGIYCLQGRGQLMQHEDVPGVDATATLTVPITLGLVNGTSAQATDVDSCWFAVRESYNGDGTNGPTWAYIHTSRDSGPFYDTNSASNIAFYLNHTSIIHHRRFWHINRRINRRIIINPNDHPEPGPEPELGQWSISIRVDRHRRRHQSPGQIDSESSSQGARGSELETTRPIMKEKPPVSWTRANSREPAELHSEIGNIHVVEMEG